MKFTLIRVEPGGEVPAHHHSEVWDYFVPLEGQGLIELDGKDCEMNPHSFLAVPPKDTHRVRNRSETEEFVFLLAQSPRGKYDFVDGAK